MLLQKFLHQGQDTRNGGRRHARARLIAVVGRQARVEVRKHLELIAHRVAHDNVDGQVIRDRKTIGIPNPHIVVTRRDRKGVIGHLRHRLSIRITQDEQVGRERNGRLAVGAQLDGHLETAVGNRDCIDVGLGRRHLFAGIIEWLNKQVLIGIGPVGRTGGDDEHARSDHVGLKTAVVAFDPHSHVATAGEGGHLAGAIGHARPDLVGGAIHVHHVIGDIARALQGSDGDHVFGGARRHDGIAIIAQAIVGPVARVAGGKDKEQRLGAGFSGLGIARRRVIAGRRHRVVIQPHIAPAVIANKGVGSRGGLLQIGIGEGRPSQQIDRLNEQFHTGGLAAKLAVHGWQVRAGRVADCCGHGPGAGNDACHVRAMAVGILRESAPTRQGGIIKHTSHQIRMGNVDASIVDRHNDVGISRRVGSAQHHVVGCHIRIDGHAQGRT